MRIRDWSSDVCSSDLGAAGADSILQSFAVVATDRNGSAANASVDVRIVDDVPTANNDVDGVAAGTYGPETGNVITGAGTVSGAAGADVKGADGAVDRKSTRLNSSHYCASRITSSD